MIGWVGKTVEAACLGWKSLHEGYAGAKADGGYSASSRKTW